MPQPDSNPPARPGREEGTTSAWRTKAKRARENIIEIFVQVVFVAILQTTDTFSDVALAIKFLVNNHPKFAAMIIGPVVANFLLTSFRWWKYEDSSHKKWSWLLVLLQFYPQYRALRLVQRILVGDRLWRKDKQFLDMITYTVEPYVESTPQVFLLTSMYNINNDMDEFEDIFGHPELFFVSLTISFVSCIYGVTKFLKNGVVRVLPKGGLCGGFLTVRYILLFLSCALVFGGKVTALGVILDAVEHDALGGSFAKGIGIWFSVLILPQLVVNIAILEWNLRGKLLETLGTHFPILLCPVFTVFSFGPTNWKNADRASANPRYITVSPLWTTFNVVFTGAGQVCIIVWFTYKVGQPAWLWPVGGLGFVAALVLVHSKHLSSWWGTMAEFGVLDPNHLTEQFVMGDDGEVVKFDSESEEDCQNQLGS